MIGWIIIDGRLRILRWSMIVSIGIQLMIGRKRGVSIFMITKRCYIQLLVRLYSDSNHEYCWHRIGSSFPVDEHGKLIVTGDPAPLNGNIITPLVQWKDFGTSLLNQTWRTSSTFRLLFGISTSSMAISPLKSRGVNHSSSKYRARNHLQIVPRHSTLIGSF